MSDTCTEITAPAIKGSAPSAPAEPNTRVPKSAIDCETELGAAAVDRRKVQECIYKAQTGEELPPLKQSPTHASVSSAEYVASFGIYQVNSAGGVEPFVDLWNPNPKSAIKYVTISLTPYNAVGDVIHSSIGGGSTKVFRFTGPLANSDGIYPAHWGPSWYNATAECLVMQSLTVEFMNGSKVSFAGKQLRSVLAPDVKNSCRVQ